MGEPWVHPLVGNVKEGGAAVGRTSILPMKSA